MSDDGQQPSRSGDASGAEFRELPGAALDTLKQMLSAEQVSDLCEDANNCLQLLGDLRAAYATMGAVDSRMIGGSEDWHFANASDENRFQDASKSLKNVKGQLSEPLGRLFLWGKSQKLELPNADFPFDARASGGVKADIAAEYELAVRRVLTALMTANARIAAVGETSHSSIGNTRLHAIEALLKPLVRIDTGVLNLGAHLQKLRTENPHGFVSAHSDERITADQVNEVQDRIEVWTEPIRASVEQAKSACNNIASHLVGLISEPTQWETELRTTLRLLGESISSVPLMMGTEASESQVVGQAAQLYAFGTQLQDARDTVAGASPAHSASDQPPTALPASNKSDPSPSRANMDEVLRDFQHAVEKHRLTFLYVAMPRRLGIQAGVRQWETVDRMRWPEDRIPAEAIDSEGQFLFKYRGVLDRFGHAAIGRFGPGKGARATEYRDGEFHELDDGSLPHWLLDEMGCSVMETSSDMLLEACKRLARADVDRRCAVLIRSARDLLHDGDQPRWYESMLVSWDYLSRLDVLIAQIKSAEIDQIDHSSATDREEQTAKATGAKSNGREEGNAAMPQMSKEENRAAGLGLLMLLAQVYYKMLESVVSTANWCSALDLELNESYLWTTKNIRNLLANHEDLRDFPHKFEPPFPDLFPTTVRDSEWDDMIAPEAEGFLSAVQSHLHASGFIEPSKGSHAWTFIEMFRDGANTAIERAHNFATRMRQHIRRLMNQPVADTTQPSKVASTPPGPATSGERAAPPEIKPDYVDPAGLVIWNGVSHKCTLSKREMTFMSLALANDHIPIDQIMNKTGQAIWRERYLETRQQREKVGKFISRLSGKLLNATPPIGMSFSLSRESHFIQRTPPLPQSTDSSRTKE